jgi:hypothetical protein
MGGTKMSEIVIGLTAFGLLYVAVIEILEKCEHRDADTEREAHWAPASDPLTPHS